jgi:hypothetical protein
MKRPREAIGLFLDSRVQRHLNVGHSLGRFGAKQSARAEHNWLCASGFRDRVQRHAGRASCSRPITPDALGVRPIVCTNTRWQGSGSRQRTSILEREAEHVQGTLSDSRVTCCASAPMDRTRRAPLAHIAALEGAPRWLCAHPADVGRGHGSLLAAILREDAPGAGHPLRTFGRRRSGAATAQLSPRSDGMAGSCRSK